ncbi:MAG: DUF4832 domain-containing protein [Planctomycetota bacterium]|jgi:hypothetical protein
MKTSKTILYLVTVLGCVVLCVSGCGTLEKRPAPVARVIVVPEQTDALLANPGMGWETFHHTRDNDENLPDWIPSTVHYARWGWDTLEPEPGKIDYTFLDEVLEETRQAGQRLAFRVMCCSTRRANPYHPAWLEDVGGKILICDYGGQAELTIPDLDDPVVSERHLDFIKRLGARYDGHGGIDHVDIGTVGWWGEWHMSGSKTGKMPTMENRKKIIDAYFAAFRKTPLLMLIGGRECLTYAAGKGAGWRADCLGDMGGFSKTWCHMCDAYPVLIPEAGVGDTWKNAPVAWESCWDMRRWVQDGWSLRYIFNYALALHGSYLNNKSVPLPEGENVRHEVERFLRRFGYRLVLRELSHPERAKAGQPLGLTMKWQNVGSAPCYKPYRVAYRLTDASGYERTLVGNVTVNKWMPGSVETFTEEFMKNPPDLPLGPVVEVIDRVVLPADIPAGTYRLAIGVVAEKSPELVIRLGIKGRTEDGWYPLSEIQVSD